MHAVKRHDQSGPNSKLPLHTDQTQHLTVNVHEWCSRWSSSLSVPCIVFFFAADKYLCSSDLFSLSLRDQLHFFHYFWLAPCFFFFPMTPYFFPLPLHCCLSEKEIQLKCLFDGEIGSVVFHFSFFVLLRLFGVVFPPPSGPPPPSVSVCLFIRFWAKMLEDSSVTVYFRAIFFSFFSVSQTSLHPLLPWIPSKPFHATKTHIDRLCSYMLSPLDIWLYSHG